GVTGVVWQSAAMGVEVGDGDVRGDPWIAEGEGGIDVRHPRVPANLTLANETGDHGRPERFGDRGELEDGAGVHRLTGVDVPYPEAFGEHDLVVRHHADGDAGDSGAVHHIPDDGRQLLERAGNRVRNVAGRWFRRSGVLG